MYSVLPLLSLYRTASSIEHRASFLDFTMYVWSQIERVKNPLLSKSKENLTQWLELLELVWKLRNDLV